MRKILCPVDFSTTADHAVATAAKLAQKTGSQLDLFNVQSALKMSPSELLMGAAVKVAGTTNRLEELTSQISRVYKISCYGYVQPSSRSLPQVISEVGDSYDLLVMGTDGADQTYDAIFGTNSYQVASQSSVPILLLPSDYEYEGFSNIVFAMDYFHHLTSPPEQLIKWTDLFGARLTFLQVMTEEYRHQHDGKVNEAQRLLKRILDKQHQNFKTFYSDRPVEGIIDYIKANECSILALCFRHHSFFEKLLHQNVIKDLCALTPCPLFIFHH